jgi:hypothetical protein
MPDRCFSPICNNEIKAEGKNWRRTPKKFCSLQCKTNTWAIRKTADLLSGFPTEKKIEILGAVSSRNNQYEFNVDNHCEITVQNQRQINGGTPNEFGERKVYRSSRFPSYTIRNRVRFREGVFETEDVELQKLVESNEWFGVHILRDE